MPCIASVLTMNCGGQTVVKVRRVKAGGCSKLVWLLLALGFACGTSALGQQAFRGALYSLHAATVQAFTQYVSKIESQNAQTLRDGPFLWIESLGSEEQKTALARLKAGDVEMRRLGTKAEGRDPDIPGGMIHDWEGAVFIPGVKLADVLRVLEDYNHHAQYFSPDVERARIETHDGNHFRVFLRFHRQKIVTVVLDTEHDVNYFRDSPLRAHSRSTAIRIAQVENPGETTEKEKTPGQDDGFLWKMETWWRMEERDGGVYVQNEAVTLTRDIPTGLGWLVEPFITNIPKETLQFTLLATRKAVLENRR
jgi:hypothetical protein